MLGLPDFTKILQQAKSDGIDLEDHAIEKLVPLLTEATKDVMQIEQPLLDRIDKIIEMLDPVCKTVVRIGDGLFISVAPKGKV